MRIRKKSWEDKELSTNEHLVHCPEEYKGKWKEYFGNDNPVFAEIGCGKGKFIVQNAAENPDIKYSAYTRRRRNACGYFRTGRIVKNLS